MFTFDDLIRLTPQAVQVLLRATEKDKLPIALKGASEKLRDMFFKNMSDRAGKMLRDDMEALGPVRLRDVDDAQAGIVALAKELAAQGAIEIGESKDEEMVYQMDGFASLRKGWRAVRRGFRSAGDHARARGGRPGVLRREVARRARPPGATAAPLGSQRPPKATRGDAPGDGRDR